MTGVQTRRTGTGYKAAIAGAIEHEIERPNTRSGCGAVNPAGAGRKGRTTYPGRSASPVHQDYHVGNDVGERGRSQPRP